MKDVIIAILYGAILLGLVFLAVYTWYLACKDDLKNNHYDYRGLRQF